jgi:hypothetical protein
MKTNSPIKSGTAVDNVIEFVCQCIYLSNLVVIDNDNDKVNPPGKEVDITVDVAQASGKMDDGEDDSHHEDTELKDESNLDDSKPPFVDDDTDNDVNKKKSKKNTD